MIARRLLLALGFVAASAAALADAQQQPPATVAGDRPSCIGVSFAARASGYGYNHLVTIHNQCTAAASCTVSTDVNPSPQRVTVAKDATESVTTFVGSPARVFVPTVSCTVASR